MIILGLGSNMGDREQYLALALRLLAEKHGVRIDRISSIYETAPFGVTEQPYFLNMLAIVKTGLMPLELLNACLSVEQDLGRVRILRWGPRVIDIDLLLYDELTIHSERLVLPHPGILARSFVLIPLREIAPDLVLANGLTPEQMVMTERVDGQDVKLWKKTGWEARTACFL